VQLIKQATRSSNWRW